MIYVGALCVFMFFDGGGIEPGHELFPQLGAPAEQPLIVPIDFMHLSLLPHSRISQKTIQMQMNQP